MMKIMYHTRTNGVLVRLLPIVIKEGNRLSDICYAVLVCCFCTPKVSQGSHVAFCINAISLVLGHRLLFEI